MCILKGDAIMRRGDEVLLVHQKRKQDQEPNWALPGGKAEPGELPTEAMIREVREEIGLTVSSAHVLAYVQASVGRDAGDAEITMAFEVRDWSGELAFHDPDHSVFDAAFLPFAEAIARVQANPYPWMREPLLAYLEGRAPLGTFWEFQRVGGLTS